MVIGLVGCPPQTPTLPPTTSGGGFLIETFFTDNGVVSPAPLTNTSWVWKQDGVGAAGDPSPFQSVTNIYALDSSLNGRVGAQWNLTWSYTGYVPAQVCDGYKDTITVNEAGEQVIVSCNVIGVGQEYSGFVFNPNPLYLVQPPATTTVKGSGFKSTYGMPVLQYFNLKGTLMAQATAASVSADGTTLVAKTPSLSGLPVGEYAGIISNIAADKSLAYAGTVSVTVQQEQQTATPYESNVTVTLQGAPPTSITYVATLGDSTPNATIHYTVYGNGNVYSSGTASSGENVVITVPPGTSLTGTMYATAPGLYSQSASTGMSF
jgi:hypothetical protein